MSKHWFQQSCWAEPEVARASDMRPLSFFHSSEVFQAQRVFIHTLSPNHQLSSRSVSPPKQDGSPGAIRMSQESSAWSMAA